MNTNPSHTTAFHPGEFVRVGRGRTVWEVIELDSRGHFVWLRSSTSGVRRSHSPAHLRRCSADGTWIAQERTVSSQASYTESGNGVVRINGKRVRYADWTAGAVVEWEAPVATDFDRSNPSIVSLHNTTDREGTSWLTVSASGAGSDCEAYLTRRSTLELAAQLTDMASRMSDHPDQRGAVAR